MGGRSTERRGRPTATATLAQAGEFIVGLAGYHKSGSHNSITALRSPPQPFHRARVRYLGGFLFAIDCAAGLSLRCLNAPLVSAHAPPLLFARPTPRVRSPHPSCSLAPPLVFARPTPLVRSPHPSCSLAPTLLFARPTPLVRSPHPSCPLARPCALCPFPSLRTLAAATRRLSPAHLP